MSVFDNFANTQYTDSLDTSLIPVPEGDWPAVCTKYEFRQVDSKKTGKTYFSLETFWDIDSSEVEQVTGRDKNSVRYSCFLDLTDHGTLDMGKGKNVQLGRLREALGQNVAGKPWSFGDMIGQVAMLQVTHRIDDSSGDVFAEAKKVAKI